MVTPITAAPLPKRLLLLPKSDLFGDSGTIITRLCTMVVRKLVQHM